MPVEKRDVMFKTGETFAAAWFLLPEQTRSGERVPAVAMAHGFGAVKEMYLEPFARRFAAAGIAALVFDYRGFGRSGGEPRPCPLLMILARNDAITPPESIRQAFARAGEPKRLLEIEGGHYAIYAGPGADETGQAATEWFTQHLKGPSAVPAN